MAVAARLCSGGPKGLTSCRNLPPSSLPLWGNAVNLGGTLSSLPLWGRWIAAKRQDGRGPCGWPRAFVPTGMEHRAFCHGRGAGRGVGDLFRRFAPPSPKGKARMVPLSSAFPPGEGAPGGGGRGPCGCVSRLYCDRNESLCVLIGLGREAECQGTSSVWPSASQLPQRGSLLEPGFPQIDDIAPEGKA